jgi:hypothetical protein
MLLLVAIFCTGLFLLAAIILGVAVFRTRLGHEDDEGFHSGQSRPPSHPNAILPTRLTLRRLTVAARIQAARKRAGQIAGRSSGPDGSAGVSHAVAKETPSEMSPNK